MEREALAITLGRWVYRLLLAAAGLALSACGVHTHLTPQGSPAVTETIRHLEPRGLRTLTVEPFAAGSGWWLTVQQDVRITQIPLETQTMAVVHTVTFVPSVLIGLVQCPVAALGELLTGHASFSRARRFGCWRLLGQEPVAGRAVYTTVREGDPTTLTDSRPAAGVTLAVRAEPAGTIVSLLGPTDSTGRVALHRDRLHRDLVRAGLDPATDLSVTVWPDSTPTVPLPLTARDRQALAAPVPPPLPASHIPKPFRIQVDSRDPAIAAALSTLAWRAGWCIAASGDDRAALEEVLLRQLIEAEEDAAVSPGHWQAPTAILAAERIVDGDEERLVLTLTAIGSQQVLAQVSVHANTDTARSLLGEAWVSLAERLRAVPRCER